MVAPTDFGHGVGHQPRGKGMESPADDVQGGVFTQAAR